MSRCDASKYVENYVRRHLWYLSWQPNHRRVVVPPHRLRYVYPSKAIVLYTDGVVDSFEQSVKEDISTLKGSPCLSKDLLVFGFAFNLKTGGLAEVKKI
ncbi:hypothetical protein F5884DRAFT_854671 [Xylogone sp. PMI_703]|nr:hypothetical protein F5884DRAFT_854671 [Xylogone sp. PMI_703]